MTLLHIIAGIFFVAVWIQLALVAIEEYPELNEIEATLFALGVLMAVAAASLVVGFIISLTGA